MAIILTLFVGFLSGALLYRLRVPGGMMIGAIAGTLLLSFCFHAAEMPYQAKVTAQILTGSFIGCSVGKRDIPMLKNAWKPALTVILAFLVVNVILGFGLAALGYMDLLTALLSSIAGGMSEVTLAASDMHADTAYVTVLQFVRMCFGLAVFPSWIAWLDRGSDLTADEECSAPDSAPVTMTPIPALLFFSCGRLYVA